MRKIIKYLKIIHKKDFIPTSIWCIIVITIIPEIFKAVNVCLLNFSVPLSDIVNDLNLNEVYIAENYEDIKITTVEINRPDLSLQATLSF